MAPQADTAPTVSPATAPVVAQATDPQEPATPATEQAPAAPDGEAAPATQSAPAQPLPDDVELLPEVGPDGSETGRMLRVKVDKATGRGKVLADVAPPAGQQASVFEELTTAQVQALETDAATFQYKAGGDERGVTERLRGTAAWDRGAAGTGIVYEYADGRRVVADGHQRLGLAQFMASSGQETPWRVARALHVVVLPTWRGPLTRAIWRWAAKCSLNIRS